tara:strand:- start:54 stop:344 length:291 start_codon:yes stop_codon:yes gene_type:complete
MNTQNTLVRQIAHVPRICPRSWTVQQQLEQAIRERDALLEIKRQRDARRSSEAVSEELRLAFLEIQGRKSVSEKPLTMTPRRSSRLMKYPRLCYKE